MYIHICTYTYMRVRGRERERERENATNRLGVARSGLRGTGTFVPVGYRCAEFRVAFMRRSVLAVCAPWSQKLSLPWVILARLVKTVMALTILLRLLCELCFFLQCFVHHHLQCPCQSTGSIFLASWCWCVFRVYCVQALNNSTGAPMIHNARQFCCH